MRVKVLFFAAAREEAGSRELALELPGGATAGSLLDLLVQRFPGLLPLLPALQLAVNQAYAPHDTPLAEGDEVALIPPISGG